MKEGDTRNQLDLLLHIENLTEQINRMMEARSRSILRRYPLTFAIVALFGIVAVGEGAKGLLGEVPLFMDNPLYLLVTGLLILTVLGSLYKKLDK